METAIENLLNQVKAISKKYENIAKITGENFNVFKILGSTSHELSHSAFIGELLNPKGSHGQGSIFLKLFIDSVYPQEKPDWLKNFNQNIICRKEVNTGIINAEYTEGGNIDLLISNNIGHAIVIENKIYAGDQPNQLVRYSYYAKKNFKQFSILYLTLYGDESEEAKGELELDKDYFSISYRTTIVDWLELCKKEASSFPLLRETIIQYIYLIKYLTNLSTNHNMSNDIYNQFLSSKESLDIAKKIAGELSKMENEIHQSTLQQWRKKYSVVRELKLFKIGAVEFQCRPNFENTTHFEILTDPFGLVLNSDFIAIKNICSEYPNTRFEKNYYILDFTFERNDSKEEKEKIIFNYSRGLVSQCESFIHFIINEIKKNEDLNKTVEFSESVKQFFL